MSGPSCSFPGSIRLPGSAASIPRSLRSIRPHPATHRPSTDPCTCALPSQPRQSAAPDPPKATWPKRAKWKASARRCLLRHRVRAFQRSHPRDRGCRRTRRGPGRTEARASMATAVHTDSGAPFALLHRTGPHPALGGPASQCAVLTADSPEHRATARPLQRDSSQDGCPPDAGAAPPTGIPGELRGMGWNQLARQVARTRGRLPAKTALSLSLRGRATSRSRSGWC